jgi:cold shock CspA family protein
MRALQNCARCAPRPLQHLNAGKRVAITATRLPRVPSRDEGWRPFPANISIMAGGHVSTKGRVKFFNETKGYGFLTRDEGGDVFVHRTDLPADIGLLYEGRAMNFDVEMTTRGLRAINIVPGIDG